MALQLTEPLAIQVDEASQAAEARRGAAGLAARLGFSEVDRGRAAIMATELAGNLVKHAGGGRLLMRALTTEGVTGLELMALDRGPGMELKEALRDGFSTAGSPGTGLGAVRRLAHQFDAYSLPASGSAVLARLWAHPLPMSGRRPGIEVGGITIPKPRQAVCGDAWAVELGPDRSVLMLADGLGHGPLAAEASSAAGNVFHDCARLGVEEILGQVHLALKRTRGAAVGVAEIDSGRQTLTFAGVGNVGGRVFSGEGAHHLVAHNGTAGRTAGTIRGLSHPWPADGLLVLHSDGLVSHWSLDAYPGLRSHDPSLVAGVLYRDFSRGDDDASVLVARVREPRS